jgi:hypothetical protein
MAAADHGLGKMLLGSFGEPGCGVDTSPAGPRSAGDSNGDEKERR